MNICTKEIDCYGKAKDLNIDDSDLNRALLIDILKNQYDVEEAESGVEAVAILAQRRTEFSLLLLDIIMPEMDGFEVLTYINKHRWNNAPAVIMISSDDSPANIKRAYDLGAFDYINRPFDPAIVRRRITNTMLLYARQRHLETVIAEQFYEQERNNRLMVSILSHIVEFRNGESGLHVQHVNTITKLLLKHLIQLTDKYSPSKRDIDLIAIASSLHDIGKIAIAEQILNKPGHPISSNPIQPLALRCCWNCQPSSKRNRSSKSRLKSAGGATKDMMAEAIQMACAAKKFLFLPRWFLWPMCMTP